MKAYRVRITRSPMGNWTGRFADVDEEKNTITAYDPTQEGHAEPMPLDHLRASVEWGWAGVKK